MRSTIEIIMALNDSQPVTDEESSLALLALDRMHYFLSKALNDLIEAVQGDRPSAKLRAAFAADTRDRMFQAMKRDPKVWLGSSGIPGTPDHDRSLVIARNIARDSGLF